MKVAIVYFSHSGNTRAVARYIQAEVGGDLVEIQPMEPYPNNYDAVVRQAKRELNAGFKPALKAVAEDIGEYDTLFLGSPNWWSTIAPPLQTFLSENDLSGKTLIPFITHGGGGCGRAFAEIASFSPDATVLPGLTLHGGAVGADQGEISAWLSGIRKTL